MRSSSLLIVPLALAAGAVVLVIGLLVGYAVHVVPVGEQHVVRRLGRFRTVRKPGVRVRLPLLDQVVRLPETAIAIDYRARANDADGRELTFDGRLELRIVDGVRYCEGHHALVRTGPEAVTRALVRAVARRHGPVLDRDATAAEVATDLDRRLSPFGVRVATFTVERVRSTEPPLVVLAATA